MPIIAEITAGIAMILFGIGAFLGIAGKTQNDSGNMAAGNYAIGLSYIAIFITIVIVVIDRVFNG